jgi:hypothetical protein
MKTFKINNLLHLKKNTAGKIGTGYTRFIFPGKIKNKNREKIIISKNFDMAINDTLDWIHARINKINS